MITTTVLVALAFITDMLNLMIGNRVHTLDTPSSSIDSAVSQYRCSNHSRASKTSQLSHRYKQ